MTEKRCERSHEVSLPTFKADALSWISTDDKGNLKRRDISILAIGRDAGLNSRPAFRARPFLAKSLARGFAEHCRGRSQGNHKVQVSSMTIFFRFLDNYEDRAGMPINELGDLGDWVPASFLAYFRDLKYSAQSTRRHYHNVSKVVNHSLEEVGSRPLAWPFLELPPAPKLHRNVSEEGVRLLKLACREYLKQIDSLEELDIEPLADPLPSPNTYKRRESVLCIEKKFIEHSTRARWFPGFEDKELDQRRRSAFATPSKNLRRKLYGAGSKDEGQPFYWRMLFQDAFEAYAALTIAAIETGWVDSLIWMDVNSEWSSPYIDGDGTSKRTLLVSRRGKTGSFVTSPQRIEQGSAIWAIKRSVRRSHGLRVLLAKERDEIGTPDSIDKRIRIEEIEHLIACPFIYYGHSGASIAHPKGWRNKFKEFIADFAEIKLPGSRDQILSLNFSDFRDAFARKALVRANGNVFSVQNELDHSTIGSTMRYLNQIDHVDEMFRAFALVTGAALDEVQNGFGVNTKNLLARCFNGLEEDLTDDVREKLRGMRSASGARCQSPFNPPPYIDPSHKDGELCSTQRCVLCSEGMFFPKDQGVFSALLKRAWELSELRDQTAVQKWLGTDACNELEAVLLLAREFYEGRRAEFPQSSY